MTICTVVHNQFFCPWTQKELDYLRENYQSLDKEIILANLNRSWKSIQDKSFKIGIAKRNSYTYSYFSEQEIQTIRDFYPGAPRKVILRLIPGHNWRAIISKAFALGINRDAPVRTFKPELFNLNQSEWAYLSGIIDGEGTISDSHTHDGSIYSPRVFVSNTDMNLMNWLVAKLGGTVRENGNFQRGFGQHCYVWQIHRHGAVYSILNALIPYLIIKRNKAELVVNKLKERMEVPEGGAPF